MRPLGQIACSHDNVKREYTPETDLTIECDDCGEVFYTFANVNQVRKDCEHPTEMVWLVGNMKYCQICHATFPKGSERVVAGRVHDLELQRDPRIDMATLEYDDSKGTGIDSILFDSMKILAISVVISIFTVIVLLILG